MAVIGVSMKFFQIKFPCSVMQMRIAFYRWTTNDKALQGRKEVRILELRLRDSWEALLVGGEA